MHKIKQEYLVMWQKAYDQLNKQQKLAVDTIEGPVMTIAGPGTGKTQLLAVRIGNILMQTDVFPHNILCLTYTDAGVIAMRQRLNSFIGPDAYNVNIYTFHAFCNTVIKENMQYFGHFRDLQMISDIEEIEVFRAVIDKFGDDHQLKRLKGNIYFETKRLKSLFSMMKQEKWDAAIIREAYEIHKAHISDPGVENSDYVYKTKRFDKVTNTQYEKGDINPRRVEEELKKYENVLAAAHELDAYNAEMARRERFDYQDMILWVIDKFKTIPDLLAKYQERFQYILVDEYQDTNGAQNELIFLLSDFWDQPNLFIVGDDDQSIFRFQGANMNSIIDFKDKFEPVEIVLSDNYRSSQIILDKAKKLIEFNEDRLVRRYPYLTKDLTEKRHNSISPAPVPEIIAYKNETQEEAGIVQKIMALHQEGTPFNKMAVIYSKHKFGENLVKYFSQKKIPVNVKKRVNVLNENDVFRLIHILRYLNGEFLKPHSSEDLLFEILHYEYFELSALDIASVSLLCRRKADEKSEAYLKWREVIADKDLLTKAGVKDREAVIRVSSILEMWISDIANITMGQSPPGSSYNEESKGTIFFQGCTDFGNRFPTIRKFTTDPTRFAKIGDILLSVRAPVGTMNIANNNCCIGRGLAALNSKDNCISYLFGVMVNLKQVFDRRNTDGTTFGSITKDDLYSLKVVRPTKPILESYNQLMNPSFLLQNELEGENQKLAELRDWLLPMLMNGQVKVVDVEDDVIMGMAAEAEYKLGGEMNYKQD